ncbi:DUF1850 domain-containing protein [Devosia neptuniae]|jgi:hypothetical protein|uniref:DUF1850 domain-containing protein n=1 Tax=Devosia TaxID=46913 RepID=UPI0022B03D4E|nr:DUF1850 domain-containing protein [Devosia neptuniae]MCZ4348135.1 DUF1850 domain-containing protein [Devosia neptuniae]|tara:strand:- start:8654 stop:9052 length:399 start_codon:yes stop_codon:yes gene_type:complete
MAEALCILTAGKIVTLAVGAFSLSWTHTVERTQWLEHWRVQSDGLQVTEAIIHGSGAGMEPPPEAVRRDDGWHYRPHVPPVKEVVLASSGAGNSVWTLCGGDDCLTLGAEYGQPVRLWSAGNSAICESERHQ